MGGDRAVPRFLTGYGPPHRAQERRRIVTGEPGFRLRFYPGVEPVLREFLIGFARWLRGRVKFRHPVLVTVVPHATVMGHDGAPGWAVFLIPGPEHGSRDLVRIFLAGGKLRVLEERYRLGRRAALVQLAQDLAHEVVHYEQWRDRRAISERGVNRRADALVRAYLASSACTVRRGRRTGARREPRVFQDRSASISAAAVGRPAVRTS